MAHQRETNLPASRQGRTTSSRIWGVSVPLIAIVAFTAACGNSSDAGSPKASGTNAKTTKVVIAEPVHNYLFMPLYAAVDKGYFKNQGLDVSILTASGGNHVNAVLTGEAWGFIGGLDSIAVADQRGGGLQAVVNINDQHFNALAAQSKVNVGSDIFAAMKGKTIVTGRVGGTPDTLLKVLLDEHGLSPKSDVKIVNVQDDPTSLAVIKQRDADFIFEGTSYILQGVNQGFLQKPTFDASAAIGPMAYTVIGAKKLNIDKDPDLTQRVVTALAQGVEYLKDNPERAEELAAKEFADKPPAERKSVIDALYAAQLWTDPMISEDAFEKNMEFARRAGTLKDAGKKVTYDDIVNMRFVKAAPSLK